MKKTLALLLAVAMLAGLAACGGGDTATPAPAGNTPAPAGNTPAPAENTPAAPSEDARYAESIDMLGEAAVVAIDPYTPGASAGVNRAIYSCIYDKLVAFMPDGSIVPELATSWETTDSQTYTFKLRDDVYFSNGDKFTAQSVVDSCMIGKESAGSMGFDSWRAVETATAIDENTVELVLGAVNVDFVFYLTLPGGAIINKAAREADPIAGAWVGTGAYSVTDFVSGDYTILTRRDDYWGGQPITKQISVRFVPEITARTIMLQNGESQVSFNISPQDLDMFVEDTENFTVLDFVSNATNTIGFSIKKHAFGNALIPVITTIGASICVQLAGSAVIEQVFAWPGVGRMLVEGVFKRDVPVILGCVIMTTILYVFVMLIVDLLYASVDPRIKSQYMAKKRRKESASTPMPRPAGVTAGLSSAPSEPEQGEEPAAARLEERFSEKGEAPLPQAGGAGEKTRDEPADISYSGARDYVTRQDDSIAASDMTDDEDVISKYKKRSQMGELMHRLVHNKSALAGIIILGFIVLIALASLFLSYESVTASNVMDSFSSPSWKYPFGTDNMGRNSFLRVLYGSRYSIVIGFGSVLLSAVVGVLLGSLAGYYGGLTDNIIMRISDVLASIPGLMLGMVIMVVMGISLQNLIVAVGVATIPHFIRMARASILTVKGNEFVEASRAIGFTDLRIIITQVLPNGLSPIMVQATMSLGFSIMIAASLSFLGFGVPAPTPEWGALVSAGREYARSAPWLMAFPGMAIMIIVLGFNLLGDGLRDALDPKLKK